MSDYVSNWIKSALTDTEIILPDKNQLNGYGARPEIWEALVSLTEAHKLGGASSVKQVWDNVVAKTIPDVAEIVARPKLIYHISELEKMPPVKYLIAGEVVENGITVIYGAPEAGKSFLAIDYGAQIAREKPILYIAAEGSSGYFARYSAWLKHNGHKKMGQFHVIGHAIQLLDSKDVGYLIEEASKIKPVAIFIDTLSRCFVGGNENDQKDMGLFIHACDQLKQILGCAIVIVHHTSKNTESERGSTVLRGAADSMVLVSNEEGTIKISCAKSKDSEHFPTRYCRRMIVEVSQNGEKITSCVLEAWQRVKIGKDELTQNQLRILECLASELFQEGIKAADLRDYSNVRGSSFYSALNSLTKRGHIKKLGRGSRLDPLIITTQGMNLVRKIASPDELAS